MNPLADFLDIPPSQFPIVYGGVVFFALVFLAYVRWEFVHAKEEPHPSGTADAGGETPGKNAMRVATVVVTLALLGAGAYKVRMNLELGRPVLAIALEMALATGGGLAIGGWRVR